MKGFYPQSPDEAGLTAHTSLLPQEALLLTMLLQSVAPALSVGLACVRPVPLLLLPYPP
jgi:hypothetical protein